MGKLKLERMQTQGLELAAGSDQDQKTRAGHSKRSAVMFDRRLDAPITPDYRTDEEDHPPPRRSTEYVQRDVGDPGAGIAPRVDDMRCRCLVRPTGVRPVVG